MVFSDEHKDINPIIENYAHEELHLSKKDRRRRRLRKSLSLLPNIFTLGNAFFGFSAIVFAALKNPYAAAYCILFGASLDALDGRIARLTKSTSPLGMQLDSLADAVSFCLAPAFLFYFWDLGPDSSPIIFFTSAFYALAGLFRLARFNITSDNQTTYFLGLPSTLAGCSIATLTLSFPVIKEYEILSSFILLCLGYLMISTWRFPSFKKTSKKSFVKTVIFIGVVALTLGFHKAFLVLGASYLTFGFFISVRKSSF